MAVLTLRMLRFKQFVEDIDDDDEDAIAWLLHINDDFVVGNEDATELFSFSSKHFQFCSLSRLAFSMDICKALAWLIKLLDSFKINTRFYSRLG